MSFVIVHVYIDDDGDRFERILTTTSNEDVCDKDARSSPVLFLQSDAEAITSILNDTARNANLHRCRYWKIEHDGYVIFNKESQE